MLELHCHTTYSDGTLTPSELVEAAVTAGVRALAITDHDTLSGWDEAIAAAAPYDLEIVPGVELSTVWRDRSLHVLGFYGDRDRLEPSLHERVAGRVRRARAILDKLAALGYPVELPVLERGMAPGRPHIAQALVAAGYVTSARDAFDRWLHDDGPAYVHYEKFSAIEGIQLLRECGAVPVWAHPCLYRGGQLKEVLGELVAAGLMGIEVYHPNHRPAEREHLLRLASDYGLVVTGGSDYHGPSLGGKDSEERALNDLHLPLDLLAPLRQAQAQLV